MNQIVAQLLITSIRAPVLHPIRLDATERPALTWGNNCEHSLPNSGHPEFALNRKTQRTKIPQPRSCHQHRPPAAARSQNPIKQNIVAKWPRPLLISSTSLGPSETDTRVNQKFASFFYDVTFRQLPPPLPRARIPNNNVRK